MILIASAAYVNPEFLAEFGRLPPTFLPLGNRRLFERQVRTLRHYFPLESIYISLPSTYSLSPMDVELLSKLEVQILISDESLSLAESLVVAIKQIPYSDEGLRLLHGDTLFEKYPLGLDLLGLAKANEDYQWEVETVDFASELIWAGYFSFSKPRVFLHALLESGNDFVSAVRNYEQNTQLLRINMGKWFDFGHINTYFQSRSCVTTERSFNKLLIKDGLVKKTGISGKIKAECNWFINLPKGLRQFCPQLIDHGMGDDKEPYYVLEYLPFPPLNELFVHGRNPVFFWSNIFELITKFLKICKNEFNASYIEKVVEIYSQDLLLSKTLERFDLFISQSGHPGIYVPNQLNGKNVSSLGEIVEKCWALLRGLPPLPGILHGDLCLSNILFDSRSNRIKVVDPRGLDAKGFECISGDLRYDLGKLSHSIIGLYDHIITGAFTLNYEYRDDLCVFNFEVFTDERVRNIQAAFLDHEFLPGLKPIQVMPLTILLFVSLLPMHADSPKRQAAFLANALRLYNSHIVKS